MRVHDETHKGMGYMCCGPWMRGSHAGFRLTIGLVLILIGSIWYGVRMGWIDAGWFHSLPFFPLVVIMIGLCLVYRGWIRRRASKSENSEEI